MNSETLENWLGDPERLDRAIAAEFRRRGGDSFVDFIDYISGGTFIWNFHHERIANKLEAIARGGAHRLMIFAPPRHGKSEVVSRYFPAFYLGRNPEKRIIATSYGADLAQSLNSDVQRIMTGIEYQEVFPRSSLNNKQVVTMQQPKRNRTTFDIVGNVGGYRCAGVGGAITGTGADLIVLDDPVKNQQDADSIVARRNLWKWYTTTLSTRLESGGSIVLMCTRWNEDDVAGRLLTQMAEDDTAKPWEVMSFPAVKETAPDSLDRREVGAALWPAKFTAADLSQVQKTLGSRAWSALYQQNPHDEEGGIFHRSWFPEYEAHEVRRGAVDFYLDTAYTKDKKNDQTAIVAYFSSGNNLYLLHCQAVRMEFGPVCRFIQSYVSLHGSQGSKVYVEPKASGLSIVQQLKENTRLNIIADRGKHLRDSKIVRARAMSPKCEGGRVFVPVVGDWKDDFFAELTTFPNGANDDRVDAFVGAMFKTFGRRIIAMRGRKLGT